jgi:hypothetical protein
LEVENMFLWIGFLPSILAIIFARWVRIVAIAIVNATGARSKKSRTPI